MKNKYSKLLEQTNVVGVIACKDDLVCACRIGRFVDASSRLVDIFEVRLDKIRLSDPSNKSFQQLLNTKKPLIITVRDAGEGGGRKSWTIRDRRNLYKKFLRYATFIDIEASTVDELMDVVVMARKSGVGVIVSYHDFEETPTVDKLLAQADICRRVGGSLLKVAVSVSTDVELNTLQNAMENMRLYTDNNPNHSYKVASMVIGGKYAKISRYLDAINGGPLIYGYLKKVVVKGQPKASGIRNVLAYLRK